MDRSGRKWIELDILQKVSEGGLSGRGSLEGKTIITTLRAKARFDAKTPWECVTSSYMQHTQSYKVVCY